MMLAGYKEWMEVFDENISKVWQNERKEFQKVAMLYGALDRELLSKISFCFLGINTTIS